MKNSTALQKTGLFFLLFLFCQITAFAQTNTHLVPVSGNSTFYSCSGYLYDAGGGGDCPYGADGYTIIYPVSQGCRVRLVGTYNTEDRLLTSDDVITIYDGAGTSGSQLFSDAGRGNINVVSSTGPLTVRFVTHASDLLGIISSSDGFELAVSCDGGCECSVPNDIMAVQGVNGVDLSWTGTSSSYILEYGLAGFTPGTGTTVIVNGNSYTVTGLSTYATYDFYIYYDCGGDGVVTNESPGFISFCVPDGISCIDFSDLNAPNITCTYGTFSNPYASVGVIDTGYTSAASRHTIHHVLEYDPRTGYQLPTIPPCELYSVRLGNWQTGAEAESIAYDYTVDTTIGDILLLKYAAVLENPGHTSSEQPRFDFEILDQNNNRIDPECGYASFISHANLGWHQVGGGDDAVLWKDWTNVGFDVTAYHGQVVRVRLTTYDCEQSGHYGYAYFTLNCQKKAIFAESCGETSINTFTAPSGFNYNWYYANDPSTTIATTQSVTLNTSGHNSLYCHVSFLNNPNCGFDLTTSLDARYPLADFEAMPDSCGLGFRFINNSSVSLDGITPNANHEPCETAHWNFGDGTTSDEYSPSHTYAAEGTYVVTLVVGLSDDQCQDSISFSVTTSTLVPVPFNANVCEGYSYDFNGRPISEPGVYLDTLISSFGCDSISELHLSLIPTSYSTINESICIGNSYDFNGQPLSEAGTYYDTLTTGNGCDSIVELRLSIVPTDPVPFTVNICPGDSYNFGGTPISEPGVYLDTLVTSGGCDSISELHLAIAPVPSVNVGEDLELCGNEAFPVTVTAVAGDSLTYRWNTGATTPSVSVGQTGTYAVTVTNRYGCTATDEMQVLIPEYITVSIEMNGDVCKDGAAILSAVTNAPNVLWNTGENSTEIEIFQPGLYIVRAYDEPCGDTASINLPECPPELEFPNIITPNGDGKNDVFAIRNLNPSIPNLLSIYDRWGKKVFEMKNYKTYVRKGDTQIQNKEEGFSGEKNSDGVYYFTFHYESTVKVIDYHGTITVIR